MDSDCESNDTAGGGREDFDDLNDLDFSPIDRKPRTTTQAGNSQRTKKPKKTYKAKVQGVWDDDEIFKLIKAVEVRRILWDSGAAEYKLPKANVWQEVTDIMEHYTMEVCKPKWANLRITFKATYNKYRHVWSRYGRIEQTHMEILQRNAVFDHYRSAPVNRFNFINVIGKYKKQTSL